MERRSFLKTLGALLGASVVGPNIQAKPTDVVSFPRIARR